jgi:exodeoxyribonuclease-5
MTPDISLTVDQQLAIRSLWPGLKDGTRLQQTLGGYAGTGKTTIISYMLGKLKNTAVCAFTGKAANVLRKKGVDASTIHSLIYEPYFESGVVQFELRSHLDCVHQIIVDEASMVSSDLHRDLSTFGLPILFVGDHGQLEPVGSDFNLMKNPDFRLEKIHRNAGDIAKFAEWLRFDRPAKGFRGAEDKVILFDRNYTRTPAFINMACESDQVICAYNKTRVEINARMRANLGRTGLLVEGEKVMCLRNNKKLGIFNGQQGTVVNHFTKGKSQFIDFESDGEVYPNIRIAVEQFGQDKTLEKIPDGCNPFDYAYCITCHKSQGDEFGKVVVVEQKCQNWEHKRWAYTAASRAKDRVLWIAA